MIMNDFNYSAYALSELADCYAPDSLESPGAVFLTSIQDDVNEAIASDRLDDNDLPHEIADNAPDVNLHQRWREFLDLGAYCEQPELGEWPTNLTDAAGVALYQIAERLVHRLIAEASDRASEEVE